MTAMTTTTPPTATAIIGLAGEGGAAAGATMLLGDEVVDTDVELDAVIERDRVAIIINANSLPERKEVTDTRAFLCQEF